MLWLKYFLLFPFFLLMRLSAYLLAPVSILAGNQKHLDWPFEWMMTDDNDLGGDEGWLTHITGDRYSYWNKLKWIFRNGGNHASYHWFGCLRSDPYPLFRKFYPVGSKYLELFFGWNMPGPVNGRCKYVFQIRLRTFT